MPFVVFLGEMVDVIPSDEVRGGGAGGRRCGEER